jgi:hypothetical protein
MILLRRRYFYGITMNNTHTHIIAEDQLKITKHLKSMFWDD